MQNGRNSADVARSQRTWCTLYSGLAVLGPSAGLFLLDAFSFASGGPPYTLVGEAKRAFVVSTFDAVCSQAGFLLLGFVLTAVLLRHLAPKTEAVLRTRRVLESAFAMAMLAVGTWALLSRAALELP